MKMAPGSPLDISLQWDEDDVQPVGRLAYRDQTAYLEYDVAFQKSGLEISPVHDKTSAGLKQPYDAGVFEGLHGVFHDSLPDGWGRLLVDRRARQLSIEPAMLTPLDRLACVGSHGIGALCYTPSVNVWDVADKILNLDQLSEDARRVLEGDVGEVISILGQAGGSPGGARPKALISSGCCYVPMNRTGASPCMLIILKNHLAIADRRAVSPGFLGESRRTPRQIMNEFWHTL